ncbi:MAG TPA: Ig-like domain repeat protein [Vicinamibacterales bacterium]
MDGYDDFRAPVPAGDRVPRWLVVLGVAAGLALFVALLRYAIDLLGVVFVITLVGFALRTLSDWLTEGESVSGWAMSAVSFSLIGTVLVGVWLFNSGGRGREVTLPGPVQRSVAWLERQGWGQRVLLPGGSLSAPAPASTRVDGGTGSAPVPPPSAPVATAPAPVAAAPAPSAAASRGTAPASATRTRPAGGSGSAGAGSAQTGTAARQGAPAADREGAAVQHAATESGTAPEAESASTAIPTTLSLTVSPDSPVVGQSVRLTARLSITGDATPAGTVGFYDGTQLLGRSPLRRVGDGWEAFLVTLRLSLGDHDLQAVYDGSDRLAASRSPRVPVSITRR